MAYHAHFPHSSSIMHPRFQATAGVRAIHASALPILMLAALAGCGGGGDSSGGPTAVVTSASVSATRYGSPALVTINGTGLDGHLAVTSAGCKDMTRLTSGSNISTATTAYYSCTVSGALSSTVVVKSNNTQVGSAAFAVAQPIVTMAVSNGQGVNGNITFTLAAEKAPKTVDNFLSYVNSGFYNGLIFHRVVAGFIMQSGGYGPTVNGALPAPKATNAAIAVESTGLSNVTWSVAMANTGDPGANTTSQFYVNLANNTGLDGGYAVFGAVTAGTTVAQAIVSAPANCTLNSKTNTTDCLPIPNVVISTATQTQ